jgi:hypothetical protein
MTGKNVATTCFGLVTNVASTLKGRGYMFDSNKKRLINTKSQASVPSLHSGQAQTNSKPKMPMTKTTFICHCEELLLPCHCEDCEPKAWQDVAIPEIATPSLRSGSQ